MSGRYAHLSSLRIEILRNFGQAAVSTQSLGPSHQFAQICSVKIEEEGFDELSITALRVMLDQSETVLPATHPGLFELRRALIRFYRRNRKFVKAEEIAVPLINDSTGRNARLALTEKVYILND